jgi:corrinoid protein of di/trimethylamine methyltransferase
MSNEEQFDKLVTAIKEGRMEDGEELARNLVSAGVDPVEALNLVTKTLKEIGDAFARGDLFLVHMIMSAESAKSIIDIFTPELSRQKKKIDYLGRVIIGTVAGDIHDIGKRLVATFLEMEGFEVIDLGIDVPTETFVEKIKELEPDVLGLSALITSTMQVQGEVIEALQNAGIRNKVKVIVGGSAVMGSWAEEIGADGFGTDAVDAAEKIKKMI